MSGICRAVMISVLVAGISAHAEQDPASGHGAKHAAQQVVTSRDIASITYPSTQPAEGSVSETGKATSADRPRRLLMNKPRCFDREGVYIWRNAGGIWQVQAVSQGALAITCRLESENAIILERSEERTTEFSFEEAKPNVATFTATGVPLERAKPVQFRGDGAHVQFDLRINAKIDTNCVYIGSRCINPATIPFQLDNYPLAEKSLPSEVKAPPVGHTEPKPNQAAVQTSRSTSTQVASRSASGGSGKQPSPMTSSHDN